MRIQKVFSFISYLSYTKIYVHTMENSDFQIVEKNFGQFEMVKLAPVTKMKNSKSFLELNRKKERTHTKDCDCMECHPTLKISLPQDDVKPDLKNAGEMWRVHRKDCQCSKCCPKLNPTPPNKIEIDESNSLIPEKTFYRRTMLDTTPRVCATKTYARVRNKEITPTLIQLKKTKGTPELETVATIKAEPELDIVDTNNQTLLPTEDDMDNRTGFIQITDTDNKSNKIVPKVSRFSNSQQVYEILTNAVNQSRPALLQLAEENIKCNVCCMTFPKGKDQAATLRKHFLNHKNSVVRTTKDAGKGESVYRTDDCQRSPWRKKMKLPVILNSIALKKKVPKTKTLLARFSTEVVPHREKVGRFVFGNNLPRILRRKKPVHVKPLPGNLLRQLHESTETTGKPPVMIGSTLIKPIRQTKTDEMMGSCEINQDADDDVVIIEQKPELIVIDDNEDDDDETK